MWYLHFPKVQALMCLHVTGSSIAIHRAHSLCCLPKVLILLPARCTRLAGCQKLSFRCLLNAIIVQSLCCLVKAVPPLLQTLARRILAGSDPLMRVQVTRLSDGDILAISISHVITDGVRWPALAAHLAARYREHASGVPADPSHLLQPTDRRLMSSADMAVQLGCEEGVWRSHRPAVAGSLSGYWNLGKLLLSNAWQQMELLMLYIPAAQVAALKQLATGVRRGRCLARLNWPALHCFLCVCVLQCIHAATCSCCAAAAYRRFCDLPSSPPIALQRATLWRQ